MSIALVCFAVAFLIFSKRIIYFHSIKNWIQREISDSARCKNLFFKEGTLIVREDGIVFVGDKVVLKSINGHPIDIKDTWGFLWIIEKGHWLDEFLLIYLFGVPRSLCWEVKDVGSLGRGICQMAIDDERARGGAEVKSK